MDSFLERDDGSDNWVFHLRRTKRCREMALASVGRTPKRGGRRRLRHSSQPIAISARLRDG
jgi:hypothetical protein